MIGIVRRCVDKLAAMMNIQDTIDAMYRDRAEMRAQMSMMWSHINDIDRRVRDAAPERPRLYVRKD